MSNKGRGRQFFDIEEDGQEDYEEESDEESGEELFDTTSPIKQLDFEGDYVKLVNEIITHVHTASLMEMYFRVQMYKKLNVYIRIADIYLLGLEIIKILMGGRNVKVDNGKKVKTIGRRNWRKRGNEYKPKEVEVVKEEVEKIFVFCGQGKKPERFFKNSVFLPFDEGYKGRKSIVGIGALERAVHHVVNKIETDPLACLDEIFSMVTMLCEGPRFKPLFEDFKEVDNESAKPLVDWLVHDWEFMTRFARKRKPYHWYQKPTDLTNREEVEKLKRNPAWTDDNLSIKHDHLNYRHSGSENPTDLTKEEETNDNLSIKHSHLNDRSVDLKRIIRGLAKDENASKCNALDEFSKFNLISSSIPDELWEKLVDNMLGCLEAEEFIRIRATKQLKRFDPALVLPKLVLQVSSSSHSYLTRTLLDVLRFNNDSATVISMMLDCMSHNFNASSDNLNAAANGNLEGLNEDSVNRVFKLIPEWSRSVTDWKLFIEPLVDKMLADPNPVILNFLQHISNHLGEEADLVFKRIVSYTESQPEIDDICQENDVQLEHSDIDRLCPLLILRLIPCKVFSDLESHPLYGDLNRKTNISGTGCIATFLCRRAFNNLESEKVRKLSAELCGSLHPDVLFPTVSSELECAKNDDIPKIKACILSICTSLEVRGIDSVHHRVMPTVKKAIGRIMLLPSTCGDEISEARDRCIDCFATMVCIELQDSKISSSVGKKNVPDGTFHKRVIDRLISEKNTFLSTEQFLLYRLCMANVLTSACQKISGSGKTIFGLKTITEITSSIIQEKVKEPKIIVECINVLRTIVDELKPVFLQCSCDLLRFSLNLLQLESEEVRIGGAKLLSSLLARDEVILPEKARNIISSKSEADSSPIVRSLLKCLTSH